MSLETVRAMDGSVSGFSGPIPSPRAVVKRGAALNGLGGLSSGGSNGGRPSRSAVELAAAAATRKPLSIALSPREPTIGAELRTQMGLDRPAPSSCSPRQSVAATVAGARGRWNNLIESADDEVRAIMTPDGGAGFVDEKDDFGFGDLGLDEHERAVLELSLRRQAKIERKLNRMAQAEKDKKSRSRQRSSRRQRDQRKLDLSNGTAGPEQFAAAAAVTSPRSSRRARGVIQPMVPGRHADDNVSQWDDEVAHASGLPAVRGASATPTEETQERRTARLKASAPLSARGSKQSPRGEAVSSRRRERRARRERLAAEDASDDEQEDGGNFSLDGGMKPTDKMEALRLAMAKMDGEDLSTDEMVDSENPATATTTNTTRRQGPAVKRSVEDVAEDAAVAAAAKVAEAKAKAEAAVKEAARLAEMELLAAAAAKREAALKSELQALKLGQLCTRAMNDGIDALALEQAQDSDAPKDAVMALIVKAATQQQADAQPAAECSKRRAETEATADHAVSSLASNPTEPGPGDAPITAGVEEEEPAAKQRSEKSGRRRRTLQLNCPECSEKFKAHAPVKQKRTRKSRCGGCGEALTVGFCPGCAELTVWTAAARTRQNASCTSCSAAFHVAKCPGCAEVAAYVGTHAAAQFSAVSSGGSPHTRSKIPGSATASAECSGLTCENCSLHFFECGCPACGVWGSHPARILTALMGGGGKKGGPELECEACTYRFKYKPNKHRAPDPFCSSSSDDAQKSRAAGSDGDASCTDTETESEEDQDWVTPQEWRSWRAPREQRWDNVESHSGGTVLGAGLGRPGDRQSATNRTGAQSGSYGAGGSGSPRRPGAAPTASAVMASSTRHLSKGAKASLHLD